MKCFDVYINHCINWFLQKENKKKKKKQKIRERAPVMNQLIKEFALEMANE